MPDPALPQPRTPAVLPGRVHYRRRYSDALGRAMPGVVTIINRTRLTAGPDTVIPASSTRVDLGADGWLDVQLPPGTYQLKAQLRTPDGSTFVDDDTVTLNAGDRTSPGPI